MRNGAFSNSCDMSQITSSHSFFLSDGDFRDTRARFSYITLSFMYLHCLNISHWLLRFSFFCSISSESIPGKQVKIAVLYCYCSSHFYGQKVREVFEL